MVVIWAFFPESITVIADFISHVCIMSCVLGKEFIIFNLTNRSGGSHSVVRKRLSDQLIS